MALKKKASFAPYLFDEYKDAVETSMDWDERLLGYSRWSEFKKPYLYDNHTKSERIGDGGRGSGRPFYRPPISGGGGGGGKGPVHFPPSCVPEIKVVGGSWKECSCDVDCCVTVTVSCPDAVLGVTIAAQDIRSAGPNRSEKDTAKRTKDGLVVTQCGFNRDEDIAIDVSLKGPGIGPSLRIAASERTGVECEDCDVPASVTIGYTTQQMSTSGSQTVKASGGRGPYRWTLTAGTGTFSTSETEEGRGTVYTAPATNVDCLNNPTITVTDACGRTASIKMAVNGYSGSEAGATHLRVYGHCVPPGATYCSGDTNVGTYCVYECCSDNFKCDGTQLPGSPSAWCNGSWLGPYECNDHPTNCCGYCDATCLVSCGTPAWLHSRTPEMLALGCCPTMLLT
jgi:hypothetical protein